jgi:hypothetical protein
MMNGVEVVAAATDMAVEEVDLADDRGPTLLRLATTMIDLDAVVAVVGDDTAVVAIAKAIGKSIVMVGDSQIMEDHLIADRWLLHRRTLESKHTPRNGMLSSQCCVDSFGRRSWRKSSMP